MDLGRYRLIEPISAGRDGSSYRARSQDDDIRVEVYLANRARTDDRRWRWLTTRVRTAKLLEHPQARRILENKLELSAPLVVVEELPDATLADLVASETFRGLELRVRLSQDLAEAVDAGHRLGLAHGGLSPLTIWVHETRGPILDWTGLETNAARQVAAEAAARACRVPGADRDGFPTVEADRYALGSLVGWILSGQFPVGGRMVPLPDLPGVAGILDEMISPRANERATAADLFRKLSTWRPGMGVTQAMTIDHPPTTVSAQALTMPISSVTLAWDDHELKTAPLPAPLVGVSQTLGRFRLLEKLGQGGMGSVFRGEDLSDGSTVAIKVLNAGRTQNDDALKRFLKEARLLSEVNSPYVTNFIEVNADQGVHFLVLEYVAGKDLTSLLKARGKLDERSALSIAVDIAKALGVAHERGIVHRDIKPENVLIVEETQIPGSAPRVKLSDFGIAKALEREESTVITQVGTILGTPLYMSPEQCEGGELGPWSDVYSLGATLFHMLAGRPPFESDTAIGLIHLHRNQPAPALRGLVPGVSEGVEQVVRKCLAKRREDRYGDASELLSDLERLIRGEPTGVKVHPLLPEVLRSDLVRYDWTWELKSSPEKLWPHVSNTERLNRAVGIPAVLFRDEADADGAQHRFGHLRKAGMNVDWEEHPFEWVEGRRMGVFREYSTGPFQWFASVVELEPTADGGTTLTHRVRLAPKGIVGKGIAALEIGLRGHKAVEEVYRRIDAAVSGRLGVGADGDPFESASELTGEPRRRVDAWMRALGRFALDPSLIETLGDYVARGPVQELARIRPLALARLLKIDPEAVLTACLIGASEGVLVLHWDLICPVCRVPAQMLESLRSLEDHGDCPACRSEFPLDFAQSVELIFRVHPEIRSTEVGTYCLGGPANAPHVVAQVRVAPGERLSLDLALGEGQYVLRGPQLPFRIDFRVGAGSTATRWELDLGKGPETHLSTRLKPGLQVLNLSNPFGREVVVRIERTGARVDALTAARASSHTLFRALFPGEVLQPGRLISLATITFLVTELPDSRRLYERLGDAGAFSKIHEQFRKVEELARREGGSLVKTIHEGVVLAFDDARNALRTALAIPSALQNDPMTQDLKPRIGVHRGPAMVATLNNHLDYFGATVRLATSLPEFANPGGVAITSSLAADPVLAELIAGSGRKVDVLQADLPELVDGLVYRIATEVGKRAVRKPTGSETQGI